MFPHCSEMGRVSPILSVLLSRSSERSFPQSRDTHYQTHDAQTSHIITSYKLCSDQVTVDDDGLSAVGLRFQVGQLTKTHLSVSVFEIQWTRQLNLEIRDGIVEIETFI